MIDKMVVNAEAVVADIYDGASVMISSFGMAGMPGQLIDVLIAPPATP